MLRKKSGEEIERIGTHPITAAADSLQFAVGLL